MSRDSAVFDISVIPAVPAAPSPPIGVSSTAGSTTVTVFWNTSSGATSYNLYWATSAGVNTGSNKITGVTSPYTHSGRTNGVTYFYKVSAVNAAGESGLSAETSAQPQAVVLPPPGWPPYTVPTISGQVVSIGTPPNSLHQDTVPPTQNSGIWEYACFRYYGGGALCEDYSPGGAWVVAGSGGHNAPPNIGASIFDFQDAKWKRKDNANGVPWQAGDYHESLVSTGFAEIISAPIQGIPTPTHQYANQAQLRSSQGGGTKGSYLILRGQYGSISNARPTGYAHTMNLETGLWERYSVNSASMGLGRASFYDALTNRYYCFEDQQDRAPHPRYLDVNDRTWKTRTTTGAGGSPAKVNAGFLDPVRRIIALQAGGQTLRAIDLDATTPAWTFLTLSGGSTLSPLGADAQYQWYYYPPDGCWYTHGRGSYASPPSGDDFVLYKLQPPVYDGINPFGGTWVASTRTLSTGLIAQPSQVQGSGAAHNNRFFYVPSLQCFAWIAGRASAQVQLIKP